MFINDIMKYIESEYTIINSTPCEICGNPYMAEELDRIYIDGIAYDVCYCICENCGHEKTFTFPAPFHEEEFHKVKDKLN